MNAFVAFVKKEWLEALRSGTLIFVVLLFALFGVMNPAIAKLTPWMLEQFADTFAENGLIIAEVPVSALTSWTQFFKNIPMALIAFVLLYGNLFTKEYRTGTLVLLLTKGLARYKVVLAKASLLAALWSLCYWLCFAITYAYNAYFWPKDAMEALWPAAAGWWVFGLWVMSLLVLFSVIFSSNAGVLLATGGTVLAAYVAGLFPKIQPYVPAALLSAAEGTMATKRAFVVTACLCALSVAASLPLMDKKHI